MGGGPLLLQFPAVLIHPCLPPSLLRATAVTPPPLPGHKPIFHRPRAPFPCLWTPPHTHKANPNPSVLFCLPPAILDQKLTRETFSGGNRTGNLRAASRIGRRQGAPPAVARHSDIPPRGGGGGGIIQGAPEWARGAVVARSTPTKHGPNPASDAGLGDQKGEGSPIVGCGDHLEPHVGGPWDPPPPHTAPIGPSGLAQRGGVCGKWTSMTPVGAGPFPPPHRGLRTRRRTRWPHPRSLPWPLGIAGELGG